MHALFHMTYMLDRDVFPILTIKHEFVQLAKLYCFYGSDMKYFSAWEAYSVLTGKSSEPCTDLRAYISLRQ